MLRSLSGQLNHLKTVAESSHLPDYASGTAYVFELARGVPACQAINYIDGDGVVITVQMFPGLQRYLDHHHLQAQEVEAPRCSVMAFREAHHDAFELGHSYAFDGATSHHDQPAGVEQLGYLALVNARYEIGRQTCGRVLLVPTGVHHGRSGDRLVAEIYTSDTLTPHQFVSSGVRRVENGLSYPTFGAPQRYVDALETAMHQRRGIFRHDVELANHPLLKPWSLKAAFDGGEPVVRVPGCTVTNVDNVLNEANIMVLPSLVEGAGSGLFIRPRENMTIPKGRYVCFFARGVQRRPGPGSDYELGATRSRREADGQELVYDPVDYDGRNIGRFVNQGGMSVVLLH